MRGWLQSLQSKTILPELLTPWVFFSVTQQKAQKSMPDSVGICLIFSWHGQAQEQPNIKHIIQPLASQSISRLDQPVANQRDNAMRINTGVTEINAENITQSACFRQKHRMHRVCIMGKDLNNLFSTRGIQQEGEALREGLSNTVRQW